MSGGLTEIQGGGGGGKGAEEGEFICQQHYFCIKKGGGESRFNVSFVVRGRVTRSRQFP